MPNKQVTGVAGPRGSGKDYLADYLIKTWGAAKHVFSTPMRECLKILGVEVTTKHLQDFSKWTRGGSGKDEGFFTGAQAAGRIGQVVACLKCLGLQAGPGNVNKMLNMLSVGQPADGFGEDLYSKVLNARAVEDPIPLIVVVGIRRPSDVVSLREIPGFKLIGIDAPLEVRYQRVKNRGEKAEEKDLSWDDFLKLETHEAESQIPAVMALADEVIDNGGTLDGLHSQIDRIVGHLGFTR